MMRPGPGLGSFEVGTMVIFRCLTVETAVMFLIPRLEVRTSTDVALRLQWIPYLNDPAEDGEAGADYRTNFGCLDYVVEGAAVATGNQCARDDSEGGTEGGTEGEADVAIKVPQDRAPVRLSKEQGSALERVVGSNHYELLLLLLLSTLTQFPF